MSGKLPRAIVFDVFGSVVDWRTSLIDELTAFGAERRIEANWVKLVDDWRGEYIPSLKKVYKGELPWMTLDDLHRASLETLVAGQGIEGLTEADLAYMTRGWHRLKPWPDSVAGLRRLKQGFIIAPLSNGNVSLLVDMAKGADLPWDLVLGCDLFGRYKPAPETYLGAARLLGLEPGEVMMAAAHNGDLKAAKALGLMTAFFARPTEYGPRQEYDLAPTGDWSYVASDIEDLARQLGV
ncbi:MAG: haloacid dehalogenase type II [Parvibaculum sp.]|uniref:haloacid dehalogenase type II n=1 Tax=Parvibaculum sp. TaxID=2024848 RepID=UPI003C780CA0